MNLTLEAIREWAESHPATEVAGWAYRPDACPLKNYLTEQDRSVGHVGYSIYAVGDEVLYLPREITLVIHAMDVAASEHDYPITYAEVLEAVRKCEER